MDRLETASVGTEAAEQKIDNDVNYTINACFLKSVYEPAQFDIVPIDSILSDIKTERYKALIDALPDSVIFNKAYKAAKSKLPAWALNGTFSGKVDNCPHLYALCLGPSGRPSTIWAIEITQKPRLLIRSYANNMALFVMFLHMMYCYNLLNMKNCQAWKYQVMDGKK